MFTNFSKFLGKSIPAARRLLFSIKFNYIRPKKKQNIRDPFEYQ